MTTTDRLHQTATKIREAANRATPGHWTWSEHHGRDIADEGWSQVDVNSTALPHKGIVASTCYPGGPDTDDPQADAALIALMANPDVALTVADWLDETAADKTAGLGCIHPRAIDLTNLILGDTA